MTDYAFSSMRIRIMEGRLLTEGQYQALIEAKDTADFARLMREGVYEEYFRLMPEEADFENILNLAETEALGKIQELVKDPALERLLFIDRIYHNIKTEIQASSDPEQYGPLLIKDHTSKGEFISQRHKEFVERTALEAEKIWNETKDAKELDLLLDRAYFEDLTFLADRLKSSFFKKYLRELADFSNLLSFFRSKKQGRTKNFFAKAFLPGGRIKLDDLLTFWSGLSADDSIKESPAFPVFIRTIQGAFDGDEGRRAMELFLDRGELSSLEREREDFIYRLALKAGRIQTGPEVIFSYKVRLMTEIKNLRIIFRSKEANLPIDDIKKRLCPQGAFSSKSERRTHV